MPCGLETVALRKKKKSQEAELEAAERRLRGLGHLCPKEKREIYN